MDTRETRYEYYHLVRKAQETNGDDRTAQQEAVQLAINIGTQLGFTQMQVCEHIGGETKIMLKDLDDSELSSLIESFGKVKVTQ